MILRIALGIWMITTFTACSEQPATTPSPTAEPQPTAVAETTPVAVLTPTPEAIDPWEAYQKFFLRDGRIVDTGNGDISHSEGQGYALLLAVAHDDRAAFDSIWNWTRENLGREKDHLFAWSWKPDEKGKGGAIADPNNASDGDLLIAWALYRGSVKWDVAEYKTAAGEILDDLERLCLGKFGGHLLMLPGLEGFKKDEGWVVNPSYWVFPAFTELAVAYPDAPWKALHATGLDLVEKGRFSPWELPPDWLLVRKDGTLGLPDEQFEKVYGYNAVRVPLYLLWDAQRNPEWFSGYRALIAKNDGVAKIPATVLLPSGAKGPHPVLSGMSSIYRMVLEMRAPLPGPPYLGPVADEVYYSATLGLLCNLVASEQKARSSPETEGTPR